MDHLTDEAAVQRPIDDVAPEAIIHLAAVIPPRDLFQNLETRPRSSSGLPGDFAGR